MEEKLIELETAMLAKEKNFDITCDWGFRLYKKEFSREGNKIEIGTIESAFNVNNKDMAGSNVYDKIARPTQSLLQKWMRDVHNILIDVIPFYNEEDLPLTKTNRPKPKGYFVWDYYDEDFSEAKAEKFTNYEDASEQALIEGLKLIKIN